MSHWGGIYTFKMCSLFGIKFNPILKLFDLLAMKCVCLVVKIWFYCGFFWVRNRLTNLFRLFWTKTKHYNQVSANRGSLSNLVVKANSFFTFLKANKSESNIWLFWGWIIQAQDKYWVECWIYKQTFTNIWTNRLIT